MIAENEDFALDVEDPDNPGTYVPVHDMNRFRAGTSRDQTTSRVFMRSTPRTVGSSRAREFSVSGFLNTDDPGQMILRDAEADNVEARIRIAYGDGTGYTQLVKVASFSHEAGADGGFQEHGFEFTAADDSDEFTGDNVPAEVIVLPANAGTIAGGAQLQFTAQARNAAGYPILPQPSQASYAWTVLDPADGVIGTDFAVVDGALVAADNGMTPGLFTAAAAGADLNPFGVRAYLDPALFGDGGGVIDEEPAPPASAEMDSVALFEDAPDFYWSAADSLDPVLPPDADITGFKSQIGPDVDQRTGALPFVYTPGEATGEVAADFTGGNDGQNFKSAVSPVFKTSGRWWLHMTLRTPNLAGQFIQIRDGVTDGVTFYIRNAGGDTYSVYCLNSFGAPGVIGVALHTLEVWRRPWPDDPSFAQLGVALDGGAPIYGGPGGAWATGGEGDTGRLVIGAPTGGVLNDVIAFRHIGFHADMAAEPSAADRARARALSVTNHGAP